MKPIFQWTLRLAPIALAGLTAFALEGYDPGGSGFPSRWTAPDRGEPVKYIIDTQTMPAGITTNEMLVAISNACQAWADASSVSFEFEGFQAFGTHALNASGAAQDYRIWIQCHNLYGGITNGNPARGGRWQRWNLSEFPNGGLGGRVVTNYFDEATAGYMMMDHTSPLLTDPVALEEVICHEMGHVLGLAHSSENPGELDSTLKEAMMYYLIHNDGRGASLADWDVGIIQLAQPTNNTPPYTYNRIMDAMTSVPMPTNVPGVNALEIRGYDLDGGSLAVSMTNAADWNGTWSQHGDSVLYTPGALFGDSFRHDPAGNQAWDWAYVVISDGTNLSPAMRLRVLSYAADPPDIDGLQDSWATNYNVRGAANDADGDGLSNIEEWLAGTDPSSADSVLGITSFDGKTMKWPAMAYGLYELWSSTNLVDGFSLDMNPIVPVDTNGTVSVRPVSDRVRFYRVIRTP